MKAMLFCGVAMIFSIVSCNNGTHTPQTTKQQVSQPVQKSAPNPTTKWSFTDSYGQKFVMELNQSERTAQISFNGQTKYGSLTDMYFRYPQGVYALQFQYGDIRIAFGKGASSIMTPFVDTHNGYLYDSETAYMAKDPTRRLKITKY